MTCAGDWKVSTGIDKGVYHGDYPVISLQFLHKGKPRHLEFCPNCLEPIPLYIKDVAALAMVTLDCHTKWTISPFHASTFEYQVLDLRLNITTFAQQSDVSVSINNHKQTRTFTV